MHIQTLALRGLLTSLLLCAAISAAANDSYVAAMRYVSIDATADNANSTQLSGTASFTVGRYVWLQGTIGKVTDDNADRLGDLRTFGVGSGVGGESLRFGVNFNSYRDERQYRQRDLSAALEWFTDRLSIGLDAFHRVTDNSIDTTQNFPLLGLNNVALHIDEELVGNGLGLHADFNVIDNWSVSLGGMSYDYDSDYEMTSSSNPILIRRVLARRPTISALLYLNNSGVTRSLALLDSTYNAGLRYRFETLTDPLILAARYFRDQALDTDDVTHTTTLGATLVVSERWYIAPLVGYSSSGNAASVSFGSMSLSYNW